MEQLDPREQAYKSEVYRRAQEKVQSFLPTIDPELEVEVNFVTVTQDDKQLHDYETLVLNFTHRTRPDLRWTMEIEPTSEYVQNRLENVVRNIYLDRLKRKGPQEAVHPS